MAAWNTPLRVGEKMRVRGKGATVRAGSDLDSTVVASLKRGEVVRALRDSVQTTSDGRARLRLVEPVAGWVTAKLLEDVDDAARGGRGAEPPAAAAAAAAPPDPRE